VDIRKLIEKPLDHGRALSNVLRKLKDESAVRVTRPSATYARKG
jgi:hypothetical protein